MVWIESAAALFGLLCVLLTIRESVWCWPAGLVQVVLYIFVFYDAKLYSDLILHAIYVVMQIYGWHHWLHGGAKRDMLAVTGQSPIQSLAWLAVTFTAAVLWGRVMATFTDAAVPYLDAFIAAASLTAQWLMARKKIESWFFWIVVDVVAIGVYLYKSLYITTALYALFLALAVSGYFAWRKSLSAFSLSGIQHENRPDSGQICAPAPRTPAGD